MTSVSQLLTDIACSELRIPTLEARGADHLDFYEVGVLSLAEALAAAYKAGQDSANPAVLPPAPPETPAGKSYMIELHAPAGVYREPHFADSPGKALAFAHDLADGRTFKAEDFEPDENALRIQQILIVTENGDPAASWTDPDYFATKHVDEILEFLEAIIEAADGLTEKRHQVDEAINDISSCAEDADRRLHALRVEGGAQ